MKSRPNGPSLLESPPVRVGGDLPYTIYLRYMGTEVPVNKPEKNPKRDLGANSSVFVGMFS